MNGVLAELGRKLAERWATHVVLPGLLFVAAAGAAVLLGHHRALDAAMLAGLLDDVARAPAADSPGAVLLVTAAALLAAGAAGLAAAALGAVAGQWCIAPGTRRPARWLARWRLRRWQQANRRVTEASKVAVRDPGTRHPPLRAAVLARDRIALLPPERPTWIADRYCAVDQRLIDAYGLDLVAVWPRLWLVVPDTVRTELVAAQDAYTAALRLSGWGTLYLSLGLAWWPAAVVAIVILATAWRRARRTTAVLADLIEGTVDLYARNLAAQLGMPVTGPLSKDTGLAITKALRKDAPVTLTQPQPARLTTPSVLPTDAQHAEEQPEAPPGRPRH